LWQDVDLIEYHSSQRDNCYPEEDIHVDVFFFYFFGVMIFDVVFEGLIRIEELHAL